MTDTAKPDHEWLVLTEGMDAYERFRFIARHVLDSAIEEAGEYVDDERIFSLEDKDERAEHLRRLDERLQEDESLDPLEQAFLCATVSSAMDEEGLESRCFEAFFELACQLGENGKGALDED